MGDEFSEIVDEPRSYEIKVDISDKSQKDSISIKGNLASK